MESLEISASTVEKAIQRALEQLGVNRKDVEVTVLKEGKAGILGLRAEEAVVRVQTLVSVPEKESEIAEIAETANGILEKLLTLMGVSGTVVAQEQPIVEEGKETTTPIVLNIKGDDLGILIGRRGQTLAALQYTIRLIVSHQTKVWIPLIIDVEGYKQRRYKALQTFAQQMAEQVKASKAPFTLEPMPAYERRIIHLALADHPDVTTQSIGEDEARKVVIVHKEQ